MKFFLLFVWALHFIFSSDGAGMNRTSRPVVVNIGAMFTLNSTIGRVAKVAIYAAVEDVNSDSTILSGSRLAVQMQDTRCNGFIGMVEAFQFMETDTVAIIGPQCSILAHVISYVGNELKVPLLSFATDPSLTSLQYPFFVRTIHSDMFQMQAVAEIVDFYGWKKVIAIYIDDDYGRNGILALEDKLFERQCKISYKAVLPLMPNMTDVMAMLVQVSMMESRIIVLHGNPDFGQLVFSVANTLQMTASGYVWIATDWLATYLDSWAPIDQQFMNNIQGVITLRQHTEVSKKKYSLISRWNDLKEKYTGGGDIHLNAYGFYIYDSVWMIARAMDAFFRDGGKITFSNDSRLHNLPGGSLNLEAMSIFNGGNLLLNEIKKINFTGLAGKVAFDTEGYLINPSYDVLNVAGTGVRTIGYWTNYTGLSVLPPEELYSNPPNRSSANQQLYSVVWPGETVTRPRGWVFPNNGVELKIGVPNRYSYQEFISKAPNTDQVRGYCVDVFVAAVNLLPYAVPYRFIPIGDGKANPSYQKLIEMIASGDLDGVVGDIAIVTNRTKIADFTQPYIESGLVVLAPIKKQNSSAWAFLSPFTLEMWCVTGLFFLLVGAVVWILEHRINDEFRGPPRKQIVTIFWFSFSTLFFAHRENTVSTLGRAVLIIWLFVVLIIQSSYTASLTSILTVQQLSSPIKGIDTLMATNDPIGFQVGSFSENYMVEELGIQKSRLKGLGSPEEYATALQLGSSNGGVVAIVDERPYVELFLSKYCKFAVVGSEFTKSGWGFAFPRDSALSVDLSTAILTLSENGDLQKIHDKWLTSGGCDSQEEDIESNRLHLNSFWGLFLICGMSCFIALLLYLCSTVRQFFRQTPQPEEDPSGQGSVRSGRSLQRFFSFVDERKEDTRNRSQRSQEQKSEQGC